MYLKDSKISLGRDEPRVLKEGLQKNVRLVGETTSDAIPIVQIDGLFYYFTFIYLAYINITRRYELTLTKARLIGKAKKICQGSIEMLKIWIYNDDEIIFI